MLHTLLLSSVCWSRSHTSPIPPALSVKPWAKANWHFHTFSGRGGCCCCPGCSGLGNLHFRFYRTQTHTHTHTHNTHTPTRIHTLVLCCVAFVSLDLQVAIATLSLHSPAFCPVVRFLATLPLEYATKSGNKQQKEQQQLQLRHRQRQRQRCSCCHYV